MPKYEIDYAPLPYPKTHYIDPMDRQNYSMAGVEICLHRQLLPFVMNVYLPTGALVVVSFAHFLIPVEKLPGRMALIVTVFLMLITIGNGQRNLGPMVIGLQPFGDKNILNVFFQAKSVTALDIWLLLCMTFSTMNLAEFAGVLLITYHWNTKINHKQLARRAKRVDRLALIVFLLSYSVCASWYWAHFMAKEDTSL